MRQNIIFSFVCDYVREYSQKRTIPGIKLYEFRGLATREHVHGDQCQTLYGEH